MKYDTNNVFAKIIRNEIPSKKICEDEEVLAFYDISAAAPVHALVIPKGEYVSFNDLVQKASVDVVGRFFAAVQKIAHQLGVEEGGYRLITSHGKDASQAVFHFHIHILAGKSMGELLPSKI